jgi:fermentation-respiration switch protein FrsA (DUF1100 family)
MDLNGRARRVGRGLGVTMLDTAMSYGQGRNERLIARALAGRRGRVLLASKFGIVRDPGGMRVDGRPDHVRGYCEESLSRLRTDVIDLYYLHRVDPGVPLAETVGAMAGLVREGKVRHLGISEATPGQLEQAAAVHPIAAVEFEWSLLWRDPEDDIVPAARRLGIGLVPYSPLGIGPPLLALTPDATPPRCRNVVIVLWDRRSRSGRPGGRTEAPEARCTARPRNTPARAAASRMGARHMGRVEFDADGITLVGDLRAPSPGRRSAGLVFTGPFTGVRDQVAGLYAERLAGAGYVTLAFDHRNFGESAGRPRQHEDPQGKLADLRAAVSFLRSRPEVDPERIGAVGICMGGGYALRFAAFDPRVKAFVGIAGGYNTPYAMRSGMGAEGYRQALESLTAVTEQHDQGGELQYLPAVAAEGEAAMGGEEPFAYYGTDRNPSATWQNSVTRASIREMLTTDNMIGADFLSPTPGLIVHGVQDAYCSPDGAREAHGRMGEPKRIVWLDARLHIDLYDTEPYVTQAVEAAAEFLSEHMRHAVSGGVPRGHWSVRPADLR